MADQENQRHPEVKTTSGRRRGKRHFLCSLLLIAGGPSRPLTRRLILKSFGSIHLAWNFAQYLDWRR